MERANITTATYKVESRFFKDFLIDIVESETEFSSWIYCKNAGKKDYLIGFDKSFDPERTIEQFTESALANQWYIEQKCFEYLQDNYFPDDEE